MFIKSPTCRLYCCSQARTGADAVHHVRSRENLPAELPLACHYNGKLLVDLDAKLPSVDAAVTVVVAGGLPGGKGGFGSMLRAIGAQIQRTTNHEAMRDLSGRRQRDINNELRMKKYVESQGERERERVEKKEKKLEKLRRVANGENKGKHDFSDPTYDKERSETEDKVHSAVEAALANPPPPPAESLNNPLKRKPLEPAMPAKKPKGMWMGSGLDELDDSDLEDSSDEEETLDEAEKDCEKEKIVKIAI